MAGFVRVRGAAFEAVSPAGFDDGACLAVGADEDGAPAGGYALFLGQAEGFEDDGLGFLAWVPVFFAGDGGSGLPVVGEVGVVVFRVPADEFLGAVQDIGGGAVVALQGYGPGFGVILEECVDVFGGGAAPGVDRLVGVSHGADVAWFAGQQPGQPVLGGVGVLEFVHQQAAAFFAGLFQDPGEGFEQGHGAGDQPVQVGRVVAAEELLVGAVDAGGHVPVFLCGGREGMFGGFEPVFGLRDGGGHFAWAVASGVIAVPLQAVFDGGFAFFVSEDGVVGGQAQEAAFAAQQGGAP